MQTNNYPRSRKNDIVTQDIKDEMMIYDLNTNKAFHLNQTSAFVWSACDGNNSVSQIAQQLSIELKTFVSEDFIWLTLNELIKMNLLESDKFTKTFTRFNRREMVKRIGTASMIALPVVSSLVAPTSADAQSTCVNLGGTCTTSAQCCATVNFFTICNSVNDCELCDFEAGGTVDTGGNCDPNQTPNVCCSGICNPFAFTPLGGICG